jgi:hypothetical protein
MSIIHNAAPRRYDLGTIVIVCRKMLRCLNIESGIKACNCIFCAMQSLRLMQAKDAAPAIHRAPDDLVLMKLHLR